MVIRDLVVLRVFSHNFKCSFNSWATGPVKSRSILEYYFAYSYLRFCTCYVDENTTIRFSEKLYPNS